MTHQQLYQELRTTLQQAGVDSPVAEARQLLLHCTGMPHHRLPLEGNTPCTHAQEAAAHALLTRRLAHEPLQYLLGSWEFYGLRLSVGEGVLIPRADTEVVVERALQLLRDTPDPVIADLCSGSGAIALALWQELPRPMVHAVELSEAALPYLRKNAAELCSRQDKPPIRVMAGDVLTPLPLPPCDLIVSNPPYITKADMHTLSPEVQREPAMALYGGEDGLDFYRALSVRSLQYLKPGGWLVFEIGYDQGESVPQLLRQAGYTQVEMECDLSGVPRCVWGQSPQSPGSTI